MDPDEVKFRLPSIVQAIQNYTQKSYLDCDSKLDDDMTIDATNDTITNDDGKNWVDYGYEVGDVITLLKLVGTSTGCCTTDCKFKVRTYTVEAIAGDTLTVDQDLSTDQTLEGWVAFRLELPSYVEDVAVQMLSWSSNTTYVGPVISEKIGDTSYTLADVTSTELVQGYPKSIMSALDMDKSLPLNLNYEYCCCAV